MPLPSSSLPLFSSPLHWCIRNIYICRLLNGICEKWLSGYWWNNSRERAEKIALCCGVLVWLCMVNDTELFVWLTCSIPQTDIDYHCKLYHENTKDFSVTISAFYGLEEIAGVATYILNEDGAERPWLPQAIMDWSNHSVSCSTPCLKKSSTLHLAPWVR